MLGVNAQNNSDRSVNENTAIDTSFSNLDVALQKLFQLQFPPVDEGHSNSKVARQISWEIQVEKAANDESDEFKQKVAQKRHKMKINQTDAIFEVCTDRIIAMKNNCNEALLWIMKHVSSESSVVLFVAKLLQRGAIADSTDGQKNTPLHYAAVNGWTTIAKKLMSHQGKATICNIYGLIPLELAIHHGHNECATFLVNCMEPARVRKLFQGDEKKECKLMFHELLEKPQMQTTVLAILDKMIEPLEKEPDSYKVFYNILEGDQHGRDPNCTNFDSSEKSCLHRIAESNSKEVVYHDVVRLLLCHKWDKFVRYIFWSHLAFYIIHTVIMILALLIAARKANPLAYDEGIDIFRGICEGFLVLFFVYDVCALVHQMIREKLSYFRHCLLSLNDKKLLLEFVTFLFRITNLPVQWMFASLTYLFQILQGLRFLTVNRSAAAYLQSLWLIFKHDVKPFVAVFITILIAFAGALYIALHGEYETTTATTSNTTINCTSETDDENCFQSNTTTESSGSNTYPSETMGLHHSMISFLTYILVKGDVIGEYTGIGHGFMWLNAINVIILGFFLFIILSVLSKLLTAQLCDTYTNVQNDAQGTLLISNIITRTEQSSLLAFVSIFYDCRTSYYVKDEIIANPHNLLEKKGWKVPPPPPINQVNEEINKLHVAIRDQEAVNEQMTIELQRLQTFTEKSSMAMMEALKEQKQLIAQLRSED